MKGIDVSQAREEITREKLNMSSGPLWRAAVLDHDSGNKYTLILYICHAATDAMTAIKIITRLLQFFENRLHQEECNMSQIGNLIYGNEVLQIIKQTESKLLQDETFKDKCWEEYQSMLVPDPSTNLLYKPFLGSGICQQVKGALSQQDTELLIRRCKDAGVTVNSALSAALNFAHIEMFRRKGLKQDTYKVVGVHYINIRRHITHGEEALGRMTNCLVHSDLVSADMLSSFWDYVKVLHMDLHPKLTGERMMEQRALQEMNRGLKEENKEGVPFYTYHISNYTKFDLGEERKIKVNSFNAKAQLADIDCCYCYNIFTFKGRLTCSVDFMPDFIESDLVESILASWIQIIKNSL